MSQNPSHIKTDCGAGVITPSASDYDSLLACREILMEARQTLATLHEIAAMMSEDNWRDLKTDIERHASYRFESVSAALAALERQGGER